MLNARDQTVNSIIHIISTRRRWGGGGGGGGGWVIMFYWLIVYILDSMSVYFMLLNIFSVFWVTKKPLIEAVSSVCYVRVEHTVLLCKLHNSFCGFF